MGQWGDKWRQVPLQSIQKVSRPYFQRVWGPHQTLTRMWVQLWCLGAEGASWGWSTVDSGSILFQMRASGVGFGTLCMTTPPTRANNVDFLCFGLIWCLFCIGRGWSWSLRSAFSNSVCAPMIINWLPQLLCAWPDGREGQGGGITYCWLVVAEHKKCSDILLSYIDQCHEVIKLWLFLPDLTF